MLTLRGTGFVLRWEVGVQIGAIEFRVQVSGAESFDFSAFNVGDYYGAVDQKVVSENLTTPVMWGRRMP